ncbi:MAG: DUF6438 domain-containing protein [Marinicellaceae bacterium]
MKSLKFRIYILLIVLLSQNVNSQDDDDERVFDDQVFIKLKYFACARGSKCPKYEIIILGNGSMIYQGLNGVKKLGTHQKQIDKESIASLITNFLNIQFFEDKDISSGCCANEVVVAEDGTYQEVHKKIRVTSNHGPNTLIEVKFGNKNRQENFNHLLSGDYLKIKQMIIKTAGVERWIKKK